MYLTFEIDITQDDFNSEYRQYMELKEKNLTNPETDKRFLEFYTKRFIKYLKKLHMDEEYISKCSLECLDDIKAIYYAIEGVAMVGKSIYSCIRDNIDLSFLSTDTDYEYCLENILFFGIYCRRICELISSKRLEDSFEKTAEYGSDSLNHLFSICYRGVNEEIKWRFKSARTLGVEGARKLARSYLLDEPDRFVPIAKIMESWEDLHHQYMSMFGPIKWVEAILFNVFSYALVAFGLFLSAKFIVTNPSELTGTIIFIGAAVVFTGIYIGLSYLLQWLIEDRINFTQKRGKEIAPIGIPLLVAALHIYASLAFPNTHDNQIAVTSLVAASHLLLLFFYVIYHVTRIVDKKSYGRSNGAYTWLLSGPFEYMFIALSLSLFFLRFAGAWGDSLAIVESLASIPGIVIVFKDTEFFYDIRNRLDLMSKNRIGHKS